MDNVNNIARCVYMTIAYSALKKKLWNKQFFIILAAEELFQHTLGHKSMKHVNAYFYIYIYMYMCIAYSALKKKCRFSFSSRYHLQLHWSRWRAVPGHLGLWLHGTWCQYHFCMCMYDNCQFNILAADAICSCTEAVDELFQCTLGHECMKPYVNTITLCA